MSAPAELARSADHRQAAACRVSRVRLQAALGMAGRHRAREIRVSPFGSERVPYEGPDGIARRAARDDAVRLGAGHRKRQYDRAFQRRSMFDHPGARRAVRAERARRSRPCIRPATRCTSICARCARFATSSGLGMLGLGFDPKSRRDDVPWMPKGRYRIMRDYMPKKGRLGLDMMLRTCTVQTNLDLRVRSRHGEEIPRQPGPAAHRGGAVRQLAFCRRTALRLSRLSQPRLDRHRSRTAAAPCRSSSRTASASSAMSITCSMCRCISSTATASTSMRAASRSAISWPGSCRHCPARSRRISDWADHLTTAFPEVRLKTLSRDARRRRRPVAPALRACRRCGSGILYDLAALDAAYDLIAGLDHGGARGDASRRAAPRRSRRRFAAAPCATSRWKSWRFPATGCIAAPAATPRARTRRIFSTRFSRSPSPAAPRPKSCSKTSGARWAGKIDSGLQPIYAYCTGDFTRARTSRCAGAVSIICVPLPSRISRQPSGSSIVSDGGRPDSDIQRSRCHDVMAISPRSGAPERGAFDAERRPWNDHLRGYAGLVGAEIAGFDAGDRGAAGCDRYCRRAGAKLRGHFRVVVPLGPRRDEEQREAAAARRRYRRPNSTR